MAPQVRADQEGRLDAVLAAALPELSRSRAAALIRDGHVLVDGRAITRPAAKVQVGADLSVDIPPPVPAGARPQDLPVRLVHEDSDLVVVDKDAGMVVHPGPGHAEGTLVNALLFHVGDLSGVGGVERPGIVHRLDRGTSGLLVAAKNDAAHRHLSAQFASHRAGRRYLALCLGVPAEASGTIQSFLARHPTDRLRQASTTEGRGRLAVTHWRKAGSSLGCSLVECSLETGRTHQVRVHLSESGWPILGDPLYHRRGRQPPDVLRGLLPADRPMLHAWELRFEHPSTGEPLRFASPPPEDFRAAAAALGLDLGPWLE